MTPHEDSEMNESLINAVPQEEGQLWLSEWYKQKYQSLLSVILEDNEALKKVRGF